MVVQYVSDLHLELSDNSRWIFSSRRFGRISTLPKRI